MDFERHLVHTAYHERRAGEDSYGDASYDAPVPLRARKHEKKRYPGRGDTQTVETTTYFLPPEPEVALGDLLDGEEVQAKEVIRGLSGEIVGWKAYLEPVTRT